MADKKKDSAVKKIFGGYPSLIFYIGLAVIVLAVVIGVGIFNSKLEKYLEDYESSLPKYTVENIFKTYFEEPDFDELMKKSPCEVNEFNTYEDYKEYFESLTKDKEITYVYVAGTDKTKINVKADGVKFASFTIKKADSKNENGFEFYELDTLSLYSKTEHNVKLRIPFNCKAEVNGIVLDEKYRTKTGITDDKRETLPEGVYKFSFDEYEVKDLLTVPEVSVYNRYGEKVTPSYDEKEKIYTLDFEYDDSLKEKYSALAIEATENYAARMQNAVSMSTVKKYFESGTELYDAIKNNPSGFVWDYESYHFENEKAEKFYAYDEKTFSCSVEMIQVMCKKGWQDYRENINITLYFRADEDGDYLVYDLVTNLE